MWFAQFVFKNYLRSELHILPIFSSELWANTGKMCVVSSLYGIFGTTISRVFVGFNWYTFGRHTVILGGFYVFIWSQGEVGCK